MADGAARTSLDVELTAEAKRGFRVAAGATALASLDGALHSFLALDLTGEARASAELSAQVQRPLDLFSRFGLVVRFGAVAEVAASVDLAISLSTAEFLDLAGRDPRLEGIGVAVLRALLGEAVVQGGVKAKVAAAAMASVGYSITGTLIGSATEPANFTLRQSGGLGLKAGVGFEVYTQFGIDQPRRLVRRSMDITIDLALEQMLRAAAEPDQRLLRLIAMPAKMAFRICLEAGFVLSRTTRFDPAATAALAQSCIQVALEEAQRGILEAVHDAGQAKLRAGLTEAAMPAGPWLKLRPQRLALERALGALPDNRFDLDAGGAVRGAWAAWFKAADELIRLGAAEHPPLAALGEPLSQIWAANELLLSCVERVSVAKARASVLGLPPSQAARAFTGPISDPPQAIRDSIGSALRRELPSKLSGEHLVEYLLRPAAVDALLEARPDLAPVVAIFSDRRLADAGVLRLILENSNALPGKDTSSPEAALSMLLGNLRSLVNDTVRRDVKPAVERSLAKCPAWVRPHVNEVILPSLDYGVNTVMATIAEAARRRDVQPQQLREACSCIVFQLLSRALIVSVDVIGDYALKSVGGALRDVRDHADDRGGPVETLARLTGIERAALAGVVEETLAVAADVFAPLPTSQRARLRDLCHKALDIAPAAPGANLIESLSDEAFVPNFDASRDFALALVEVVAQRMGRAAMLVAERAGDMALESLEALLEGAEALARKGLDALARQADELEDRIANLRKEAERRLAEAEAALRRSTEQALSLAAMVGKRGMRASVREKLSDTAFTAAKAALSQIGVYAGLPADVRREARSLLGRSVDSLLDNAVADLVFEALGDVSRQGSAFAGSLEAIDPDKDVAAQVTDLLLDRVDEAVARVLKASPRLSLEISGLKLGPVALPTIEVGRVELPVRDLAAAVRSGLTSVESLRQALDALAKDLTAAFRFEALARKVASTRDEVAETFARVTADLADGRLAAPTVTILSPSPGSILPPAGAKAAVPVEIRLTGVPRAFLEARPGLPSRFLVWVNRTPVSIAEARIGEVRRPVPALTVRISVPAGAIRGGMNVVAAAVVDGDRSRRCSASSTFFSATGKSGGAGAKPPAGRPAAAEISTRSGATAGNVPAEGGRAATPPGRP